MKKSFALNCLFVFIFLLIMTLCLTGTAFAEDEGVTPQPDGSIPIVYLDIDESEVTIEEMNSDPEHNTKCTGTFTLDVPDGFRYSDAPDLVPEDITDLKMEIRGRGNSSWEAAKKPYKIKLDKKREVLGLGKNKHWVLVANAYDRTLIRDRITAWLGDKMGFEFTPTGYPVDVVMSGEQFGTRYLGSYYLSENVRVDDNRLELDEPEDGYIGAGPASIGYLLQNSFQTSASPEDVFATKNGADWATDTPTFDPEDEDHGSPEQQAYIQDYMQKVDDALYSDTYTAEDGTNYRDMMDLPSAAKYWLVNHFTLNNDAYKTGSTYVYKKSDAAGGKLYWGPLWDFDSSWDYFPDTEGFNMIIHSWEKALLYDTEEGGFVDEVKKQWPAMKTYLEELIADGSVIDKYYEETLKSAAANKIVNPFSGEETTYREDVDKLKNWISARIEWMDEHIGDLDTIMHKVKFVVDDEVDRMLYVQDEFTFEVLEETPEKEGYVFLGWYDEDGNRLGKGESNPVTSDITYTADFISYDEATHASDIVFKRSSDVIDMRGSGDYYQISYTVLPTTAQEKNVSWSSSDESIATVNKNGKVELYKTGTVTFTASLDSGLTKSFTLTIIEEAPPVPVSIRPENDVIRLKPGEQAAITIVTDPDPAALSDDIGYSSDNRKVAFVSRGIIMATGVGETYVHITAEATDENWKTYTYEAQVKVIVSEEEPEPEPLTPEYTVTSGDKVTWTKGSGKDLVITIKRSIDDEYCFNHFTGEVFLDGKTLREGEAYTAERGSTVVTLKAAALEKMDEGVRTLSVAFDDGNADVALTIAPKKDDGNTPADKGKEDKPKTGDQTNMIWFAVFAAAVLGIVSLKKISK